MTQTDRLEVADSADEEKVIPWAEGNGLWRALTQLICDLPGVDIVTFFVQNPYAYDTAEGLALRIGRYSYQVKPILDELAKIGMLNTIDLERISVYALTEDPHRRQTLQQYVAWLREGFHWARMGLET